MRTTGIATGVAVIWLLTVTVTGQDKKQADRPAQTIEALILELGDPLFAVREKAQRELWKQGDKAIPALEKALQNDDPEIVRRARELLDKYSWGIRVDTPPEIMKSIRQFQAGGRTPEESHTLRKSAIADLLESGPQGIWVVRAFIRKNLAPEIHEEIVSQVTNLLRREIPLKLFAGKLEEADELIDLHLAGSGPEGAADYAAYQLLRGKLSHAINLVESQANAARSRVNDKLILTHLYRANGDWAKARLTASDLPSVPGKSSITESLLEEEGKWTTLADTVQTGKANYPDALLLTMLRLAGRRKAFDDEVNRIVRASEESASAEEVANAVVALLSNHQVEAGTRILLEHKKSLGLLVETLIARLKYKDALALAESIEVPTPREKLEFDLRRARLLMLTGDRSAAVKLFNHVAENLRPTKEDPGNPVRSVRILLRTEVRLGLKDLADEHAEKFVTGPHGAGDRLAGESAFEILFSQNSTVAEALFWALREKKIRSNETGPTMLHVRNLLTGKSTGSVVDQASLALKEWTDVSRLPGPPQRETGFLPFEVRKNLAIATICRVVGRDIDANAAFKTAVESMGEVGDSYVYGPRSWVFGTSDASRPWLEWGDFLFERGRFKDAALRFEEGWKKFPDQPLLLFLSGQALVKAGEIEEGQRRIELSHWVALGQERVRGRFLDELVRRGEGNAAKRETELILRACWSRDHHFGNVMNQASRAAALIHDFSTAERCVQRSLLVILKTPGVYFIDTSAYLNVPHDMLIHRARATLSAGKLDEAVGLAREALAITPGHIELVSGMVPELDRLGKKDRGEELFQIAWSAYQKLLKEFPDSPYARYALATLAANCCRELEKGQTYAEEAVKADSHSVQYREALSEVLFRRGSRETAVEIMKKLAEEEPRNPLYKRQINRYRNGALGSPKPELAD